MNTLEKQNADRCRMEDETYALDAERVAFGRPQDQGRVSDRRTILADLFATLGRRSYCTPNR
jgi:hypothetical protein